MTQKYPAGTLLGAALTQAGDGLVVNFSDLVDVEVPGGALAADLEAGLADGSFWEPIITGADNGGRE